MSEDYTDVAMEFSEESVGGEIEWVKMKFNVFIKLKSGKIVRMIPEEVELKKPTTRSYTR